MTTITDPSYVDPALINPRAVCLVEAFKDALARLRDEEGLMRFNRTEHLRNYSAGNGSWRAPHRIPPGQRIRFLHPG
jgi:hypothetical protein